MLLENSPFPILLEYADNNVHASRGKGLSHDYLLVPLPVSLLPVLYEICPGLEV